jgi:hypothetical protein
MCLSMHCLKYGIGSYDVKYTIITIFTNTQLTNLGVAGRGMYALFMKRTQSLWYGVI